MKHTRLKLGFIDIRADFQNFHGHESWPMAKLPEVAHIPFVYSNSTPGVEIEPIFALRAAISEILPFSKLPYF